MGINFREIAKISGMIMQFTPLAPFAGVVTAVGGIHGHEDESDDEKERTQWQRKMISGWMDKCKELMEIAMQPEVKASTLKGKIRSDFIGEYGELPKERWTDHIHSMVVMAVKGDLAASSNGS